MSENVTTPANHGQRKEERLFLIVVLALATVAGVGCWFAARALAPHAEQPIAPDQPRQLTDFSLTDSTGRTVTRSELDGKILAVSFLFTSCALTCPTVSERMTQIQRLTTNAPEVRLVSFTVDPRSDTPPVLARWGARYSADTNRWYLLTGNKAVLHGLIGASFLDTTTNDPFNYMPGNFTGAERIAVVDKLGRVRGYFDGMREGTPAAVVAEIERLRHEN